MNISYIVAFLVLIIFVNSLLHIYIKKPLNQTTNLSVDGYVVEHDIISDNMLTKIKNHWGMGELEYINNIIKSNSGINKFIKKHITQSGYNYMDYIMFLENSVLHTCHRDNNAGRFNNTKYPSYTLILYIDDMQNCLDVIPKSHTNYSGIFFGDTTRTFLCKGGSIILFDSSLIHAGSIDSQYPNKRIQLKISHKDDLEKLSFYEKYHKIINKPNTNSKLSKLIQKHLSCTLPVISDLTQGLDKSYINGNITPLTKVFSKVFYSDQNYYNLNNAY